MTKEADDLEAVRAIVQTLQPFDPEDRERIVRWAAEKLVMPPPYTDTAPFSLTEEGPIGPTKTPPPPPGPSDIKSLLLLKRPQNDRQLAAVVAYYYQFVAPPNERKQVIDKDDLLEACRKGDWPRPGKPSQTLVNAFNSGFLDRTGEKGKYRLNTVGENLVAMVLPGGEGSVSPKAQPSKSKARKKAPKTPRRAQGKRTRK
jgi:hypothetical protein